jgi:hypothetical protein
VAGARSTNQAGDDGRMLFVEYDDSFYSTSALGDSSDGCGRMMFC